MNNFTTGALTLHVAIEKSALRQQSHIPGYTMVDTDVVTENTLDGHAISIECCPLFVNRAPDSRLIINPPDRF